MFTLRDAYARTRLSSALAAVVLALTLLTFAPVTSAQDQTSSPAPTADARVATESQTFFLANATLPRELDEVRVDLRMMLPRAEVNSIATQSAISIRGSANEIAQAQKLIELLDKPHKFYRVTYMITETDNGKPVNSQHVALVVATGSKTNFKQGSRVPVVTGTGNSEPSTTSTQMQYLDIGLNIDASLDAGGDEPRLFSRIEQSGVAEEKSGLGQQNPVIRQTKLETMTALSPGKPQVIGSLDIPGSTRHQEIAINSELIR